MQREIIDSDECQYASLKGIAEGNAGTPPVSLVRHLKTVIRRHLTPSQDRMLHQRVNAVIDRLLSLTGKKLFIPGLVDAVPVEHLKTGDRVRVKSEEEIRSTLNHLGQTRGCAFIADIMTPYCGSVQRVFKPMERFVDERDLRVKKCKGLVLLEGVMCEGTTVFGRCDRSCFMFWREEWLEKID